VPRPAASGPTSAIAWRTISASGSAGPGSRAGADQPGRPVDAGGQRLRGRVARGLVGRAPQHLHLQLQCRQRRAQLVRRVADEMALGRQRGAEPVQQRVERLHQRQHLVGQAFRGQCLQRVAVAPAHLGREPLQRGERARHQPADHQRQRRGDRQQRHDGAQRRLRRALVAHALGLRHLDHAIARDHAEGAPQDAAGLDVREADHHARRRLHLRLGRIDGLAVLVPDLDDEIELAVRERARLLGRDRALVAQRQRHLAQLVVEQRLRLAQHAPVDGAAHGRGGQDQHREQRQQQAHAQGAAQAGQLQAAQGRTLVRGARRTGNGRGRRVGRRHSGALGAASFRPR
jgi:hypothetical protein